MRRGERAGGGGLAGGSVCVCVCHVGGGGAHKNKPGFGLNMRPMGVWTRAEGRWIPFGPPRIRPRGPRNRARKWDQCRGVQDVT
jgi:hypothetical protein